MLAVIDALDLERVAVVALNSPSVPALTFAATHPGRTSRLVVVDPIVRFRWAEDFSVGLPDNVIESLTALSERDHGRGGDLRRFAPGMADNDRYLRWAGRCARLGTTPQDAKWRMQSSMDADGRAVLPSIHVPTLACWQEGSPLTDQHVWVADRIQDAQALVLPPSEDRLFFLGNVNALLNAIESFVTGGHHRHELDRALMTLMFADIVGSTDHVAVMGDRRWSDLLTTFEASWRAQLERFRGLEKKTMGDGFLATFDGPGRALRCASEIISDVRSLGVEVRVGLHSGEVEVRESDIGGIAVHVAQRIQALAQPGEVLASSTVKDLVAGSDITFSDRGTHDLKGVPDAWRLYSAH